MPKLVTNDQPDLTTQHGRLRWARIDAGFDSMRGAAQAHGWNENTYKSHEQGIRQAEGLKLKHAERYARAFKVNLLWLTAGQGPARAGQLDDDTIPPEDRELAKRLLRAAKA